MFLYKLISISVPNYCLIEFLINTECYTEDRRVGQYAGAVIQKESCHNVKKLTKIPDHFSGPFRYGISISGDIIEIRKDLMTLFTRKMVQMETTSQ